MTPPTRPNIEEIKERCEKATKGPWRLVGGWTVLAEQNCGDMICNMSRGLSERQDNGEHIAHSRTDLPACVEWIEHLEQKLAELEKDRCDDCNGELSKCGPEGPDGEPSWDCKVCQLRERVRELEKDRERLIDGMASKLVDAASAVKKGEK